MQLTANRIIKNFGEKEVLKEISFSVDSGKALGLLGRNGAGKTTTLRILMNVFPPDEGEVLLNGKHIDRSKIKFGYLPEERGLYPKKKIMEQLLYLGALGGMNKKDAKRSIETLLERLEMTQYINDKLEMLSKGNQQKIQLVAALVSDPDIIILDEPFSGLDPVNAVLLKELVKELIAKDKIVLFSSHQMNYVEEFCDEIAIINDGKIVLSGNIHTIKHSYDRSKIIVTGNELLKLADYARRNLQDIVTDVQLDLEEVTITLKNASLKNSLINALSNAEIDIESFSVYEPSLNDIFVEYTERGI